MSETTFIASPPAIPKMEAGSFQDPGSQAANSNGNPHPDGVRRQIVVVLGMHRSGTSLLANLLTVLGVDLGENLLAGDCNNEAGYWEQKEIYRTHDDLLQQLARRWIGPAGTVPFPAGWWKLPEIRPFKNQLSDIVRGEVAKTQRVWGFKDPRTSRLLPLWKEIFDELGLDPLYLLAIRNPAMVVESVVKRDEIPASRAELLWLLHNLDAVRDAGDRLRLVVDYDRWFSHPHDQIQAVAKALGLAPPMSEEDLLAGIRERIRPNLRHCQTRRFLSLPFVPEVLRLLQEASATGTIPADLRRIDEEVRRALSLCAPWAEVVEEHTRPDVRPQFSVIEHFSEGRLEPLGRTAQAAVWDARIDGEMCRALFLHPPARMHFAVPNGGRARLTFAVNVHPHAWDKPKAGGCEFSVTVNGVTLASVRLDPVHVPSDRCWHECALDIPENPGGSHEVVFETRALGDSLDFRWAVWREPRLTWLPPVELAPDVSAISRSAAPAIPARMNTLTDSPQVRPGRKTAGPIRVEPDDASALKTMARAHLAADRHEDARAMCRRVLLKDPNDREALDLLARCRFDFSSLDGGDGERAVATAPAVPALPPPPATGETGAFSKLAELAQYVGQDWKDRPYYDEAEPHMEKQWNETIWPFIQNADFSSVLDLAAGHGRNSEKLKQLARKICIVDINQENIDFCRRRFAGDPRFEFFRNDGCSLDMIRPGSISLVYCFDAMVHFDSDVVRAYLREFKQVLRPGGLGFCHHSNYTEKPGGDVHDNPGWRNFMSEALFAHYCAKEGLRVVKSRVINWSAPGSDCVTLFQKP